ncbi:MAG: T9SS type A sorting domain-containing protein [bacterium]|nr:T9SS type A sorting domain-containing protein [bacterium]
MKALRLLTLGLLLTCCAQIGVAQDATVIWNYCGLEPVLGCGCDVGSRTPFADNVDAWCIFWDENLNGPDATDDLVPVGTLPGEASYSCQPFNGMDFCGMEGNFFADPAWQIGTMPVAPDQPVYYLKISGANCCWTSDTFRVTTGPQFINLTIENFDCSNTACPTGVAPSAPTNVQVSDDQYCTAVSVTWDHSGEGLTGFGVFYRVNSTDDWTFAVPRPADARDAEFAVCADGSVEVGVVAINGAQQSDHTIGVGRTFLRHFATPGYTQTSDQITMFFTSPPQGVRCGARLYFDLWCGGQFVTRMCEVTDPDLLLITELTCDKPAVQSTSCMIVMHDSSTSGDFGTGCGFTDTLEIVLPSDEQPIVPREFALAQNYPNPFNPSTVIEYSLPRDGEVDLAIFNLMGQRVATLVNGKMTAGSYRADWNAESMATGMYFYRLQMGSEVLTRKMLLMK